MNGERCYRRALGPALRPDRNAGRAARYFFFGWNASFTCFSMLL